MVRILHIQDHTGDTQYDLDTEKDLAQEFFLKALDEGKMAYAYFEEETVQIRDFEETENATKVVIIPNYVGG